jgi:hypothetical protein
MHKYFLALILLCVPVSTGALAHGGTDQEEKACARASLDRIDSAGHYETGNLQVVCQFINFWKSDSDNTELQRLLMMVRGVEQ